MILPKEIEEEVRLLLSQNKKIAAVKLVHTFFKCGLKEALDIVENISRGQAIFVADTRDIDSEILFYLSQGKKLQAVKIYKDFARVSLSESKEYVEALEHGGASATHSLKPSSPMNARDTQIDQILADQHLKPISPGSRGSTSSFSRFLFFIILLIAIAFFLFYIF
ncbi:hypothetical protein [Pedobacter cryoconitis]|uniref:Ribosomal protein L7/L12 n=1 Tax=Pedobacter cryoconitis TaxID=188932 RepID=A0A7X0J4W1_9SPHI|nr:hypothetical protein [Pedobacter cryoconitis]MBB6500709.1 ribosomal protein L7/L12 [Pedobacter cryoconitis]